ncbi:hypothetical protein M942_05955 [Enterobacter ludwigii]|nr:hypothetical protein M942_05955 [Enterobacter ludwigii]
MANLIFQQIILLKRCSAAETISSTKRRQNVYICRYLGQQNLIKTYHWPREVKLLKVTKSYYLPG